MNKIRLVIGTALVVGTVVPAYLNYRKIREEEIAKRIEIVSNMEANIDAVKRASLKMEQKLKDGHYRPRGVAQLFDDLEFEIIAAHLEK